MDIFNLIPQIFYDFIGRIIPGGVLLLSIFGIYYGYEEYRRHLEMLISNANNSWLISLLALILFLLASYTVSFIFSGIWEIFKKLVKRIGLEFPTYDEKKWVECNNKAYKDMMITPIPLIPTQGTIKSGSKGKSEAPSFPFIYDYIRLRAPAVGKRIVKIRAECDMCTVLISGWSILAIVNLYNLFRFSLVEVSIIEIGLLIFTTSIVLYLWNLEEKFLTGLYNYWHILQSDSFQLKDSQSGE